MESLVGKGGLAGRRRSGDHYKLLISGSGDLPGDLRNLGLLKCLLDQKDLTQTFNNNLVIQFPNCGNIQAGLPIPRKSSAPEKAYLLAQTPGSDLESLPPEA